MAMKSTEQQKQGEGDGAQINGLQAEWSLGLISPCPLYDLDSVCAFPSLQQPLCRGRGH